ncbi:MAG: NAD(P)/FAD-dependent oxidoreductase [Vicingaceae bacterium]
MSNKRIIVIGGGAAGFFAAINIAELLPDASVCILEKTTKVLSKVKVSGGGRCNVTHACFEPKELSTNYPRGERELLGPFHQFATGDTIAWFSERGVELKMEEDGRMFPVTDSSQTIIDCFEKEVEKKGIEVKLSTEVAKIEKSSNFKLSLKNGGELQADAVVVAIGGNSKIKHYDFLKDLRLQLIDPIPSLFTFNLPKHASNQLMGLSYEVSVRLKGTSFEEFGPLLFTHWGMSGPAILKLSAKAAKWLYDKSYQFEFELSWLDDAEKFISVNRQYSPSTKVQKKKPEQMPQRLWNYLLSRAGLDQSVNWADLNKRQMESLVKVLEADIYQANGKTTFKEEFVTCGGVDLKEINMKTMESKAIKDLYFCGEVMNVDAVTGGFNFQAAWTSGFLVAESIANI